MNHPSTITVIATVLLIVLTVLYIYNNLLLREIERTKQNFGLLIPQKFQKILIGHTILVVLTIIFIAGVVAITW